MAGNQEPGGPRPESKDSLGARVRGILGKAFLPGLNPAPWCFPAPVRPDRPPSAAASEDDPQKVPDERQ